MQFLLPLACFILQVLAIQKQTILSVPSNRPKVSSADWISLNASLSGRQVLVQPPAARCHSSYYDKDLCTEAKLNWHNATWYTNQIGGMFVSAWEQFDGNWCEIGELDDFSPLTSPCAQGSVPRYGIVATTTHDVQTAVNFARDYNLRITVKSTGHDYLGRSSNPDTLLVWMHNLKNITVGPVTICGTTSDAIIVGGGVQWGEVNDALAAVNRVAVGSSDRNVGASGGQVSGGGHSPLSNTYGMTADNVLQFEVVTMDGVFRTVNECENSDLFWALRGGGGGTYAIVMSTTHQTYEDSPTVFASFDTSVTEQGHALALEQFANVTVSLVNAGWGGYFYRLKGVFKGIFFHPLVGNRTIDLANSTMQPFFQSLYGLPGVNVTDVELSLSPSFYSIREKVIPVQPSGFSYFMGSRLIPKTMFENSTSSKRVVEVLSSLCNDTMDRPVLGHMVVGGAAAERARDNAVHPAWRKTIWHVTVKNDISMGSNASEVLEAARFTTQYQTEPLRQITPKSGAYMNEADSFAPNWKDDFFGEIYERLLNVKLKYDPLGILSCNRCVGSDIL